VGLQHGAWFKSSFGARNLDVDHRFWEGGVDLQMFEADWFYFALSLVRTALLKLATTHPTLLVV
jgi:hypothetical protein